MTITISGPASLVLAAAKNVVTRKHQAWLDQLDAKGRAIKHASECNQVLTGNYWQAEHLAYEQYCAAVRIFNAIEEELKEKEINK